MTKSLLYILLACHCVFYAIPSLGDTIPWTEADRLTPMKGLKALKLIITVNPKAPRDIQEDQIRLDIRKKLQKAGITIVQSDDVTSTVPTLWISLEAFPILPDAGIAPAEFYVFLSQIRLIHISAPRGVPKLAQTRQVCIWWDDHQLGCFDLKRIHYVKYITNLLIDEFCGCVNKINSE